MTQSPNQSLAHVSGHEEAPRSSLLTEAASGGNLGGSRTPDVEDTATCRRYTRSNPRQMGFCGVPRSSENGCGAGLRVVGCRHAEDAARTGEALGKVCPWGCFPGKQVPQTGSEGKNRLISSGARSGRRVPTIQRG